MADLENRFKGFIEDGEKRDQESKWKPQEDKVKAKKEKKASKNYHPIIFLLVMIVLVGGLLGGGYFYLNQVPQNKAEDTSNPSVTVQSTPSSIPSSSPLAKDQIKVLILNGTGIKGQAGKVQASLERLGYKLIDVEVADKEQDQTVVEYKPGLISAEDLVAIKTLLAKTYAQVELKENTSLDRLRITTGSLKKSS